MPITLLLVLALQVLVTAPLVAQHAGHGSPAPASAPRSTALRTTAVVFGPQRSGGPVAFEVAPVWDRGRLELRLSASTESGDLSTIDLWNAVRLVTGTDTLAPAGAEALSGHHAQARVSFLVSRLPTDFTVLIRDDTLQAPRALRWRDQDGQGGRRTP